MGLELETQLYFQEQQRVVVLHPPGVRLITSWDKIYSIIEVACASQIDVGYYKVHL